MFTVQTLMGIKPKTEKPCEIHENHPYAEGVKQLDEIRIEVHGTPRPQPRPRFVNGHVISSQSGSHADMWGRRVLSTVSKLLQIVTQKNVMKLIGLGPLRVDMLFAFPIAKSAWRLHRAGQPHTHRPDKDNLEKLVLDKLVKSGLLNDDSRVSSGTTSKIWAAKGQEGVVVRIRRDYGFICSGETLKDLHFAKAAPVPAGDSGLVLDRPAVDTLLLQQSAIDGAPAWLNGELWDGLKTKKQLREEKDPKLAKKLKIRNNKVVADSRTVKKKTPRKRKAFCGRRHFNIYKKKYDPNNLA